jgi:hypothetical protein
LFYVEREGKGLGIKEEKDKERQKLQRVKSEVGNDNKEMVSR